LAKFLGRRCSRVGTHERFLPGYRRTDGVVLRYAAQVVQFGVQELFGDAFEVFGHAFPFGPVGHTVYHKV
jgi:hypothetical protein